jgi:hypothetical protein
MEWNEILRSNCQIWDENKGGRLSSEWLRFSFQEEEEVSPLITTSLSSPDSWGRKRPDFHWLTEWLLWIKRMNEVDLLLPLCVRFNFVAPFCLLLHVILWFVFAPSLFIARWSSSNVLVCYGVYCLCEFLSGDEDLHVHLPLWCMWGEQSDEEEKRMAHMLFPVPEFTITTFSPLHWKRASNWVSEMMESERMEDGRR